MLLGQCPTGTWDSLGASHEVLAWWSSFFGVRKL